MSSASAQSRDVGLLVDHLFRSRAGQMVAWLTRLLGPEHLELAEEVVQESLLKALQHWPHSGIPENPAAWLFRAAHNAAIDAVRRNSLLHQKAPQLIAELERTREQQPQPTSDQLRDDELRMVFLCCHPALSPESRVALSLKIVSGFGVEEIARAFLAEPAAIAQRLVRAKRQLRETDARFDLPTGVELSARLDSVLEVLYLMFNEGYAAHAGRELIREDVCREALRLAIAVARSPVTQPKVHALVALMAFLASRFPARQNLDGDLILLEDQDRALWDRRLLTLAYRHFTHAAEGDELTTYHLQAAIAATHAGAPDAASTDWAGILSLYDQLLERNQSPVIALNRVVALSRLRGAAAGLQALKPLLAEKTLRNYYLLAAVHGHLLLECGAHNEAADAFRRALACPCSEPERRFLERKLAACA